MLGGADDITTMPPPLLQHGQIIHASRVVADEGKHFEEPACIAKRRGLANGPGSTPIRCLVYSHPPSPHIQLCNIRYKAIFSSSSIDGFMSRQEHDCR